MEYKVRRACYSMKKRVWTYILICVILAVYFVGIFISQQIKLGEQKETIEALEAEIKATEAESEALKKEIEHATSRETIEAIARQELGLVYPDERTFLDANAQ